MGYSMHRKRFVHILMRLSLLLGGQLIAAPQPTADLVALEREMSRSQELIAQMKIKLAILQTATDEQEKPQQMVHELIDHDKHQIKKSQEQLATYRSQGMAEHDPQLHTLKDQAMHSHLELHELEGALRPQVSSATIAEMRVRKEGKLKNFMQEKEAAVKLYQKKIDDHKAHAAQVSVTSSEAHKTPEHTAHTQKLDKVPAAQPSPVVSKKTVEPVMHEHMQQPVAKVAQVTQASEMDDHEQQSGIAEHSAQMPGAGMHGMHNIRAERGPGPFKHNFSGFIRYDGYFDTRQTVGMREDIMLKFPEPRIPDSSVIVDGNPAGPDVNDRGQFTQLAALTRLRLDVLGPDVLRAKASAVVETDFFGAWVIDNFTDTQVDHVSVINSLCLRLAYLSLAWEHWAVLFGQQWHPFSDHHGHHSVAFMRDIFQSMTFNPQIRVTARYGRFECVGAALAQQDNKTFGIDGFSTKYLRNAIIPNFAGQLKFFAGFHEFCVGLDYKTIVPRLKVDTVSRTTGQIIKTFAVNEFLNSLSASAYASLNWAPASLFLNVTYAENLQDHMMLGGYAPTQEGGNAFTGEMKYTNIRNLALVADLTYRRGNVEPGFFVGVTKNLGANKIVFSDSNARARVFSLGAPHHPTNAFNRADIDTLFAVAPRVIWFVRPVVFAAEVKYLRAAYGQVEPAPSRARVINTEFVNLFRFALAVYYLF